MRWRMRCNGDAVLVLSSQTAKAVHEMRQSKNRRRRIILCIIDMIDMNEEQMEAASAELSKINRRSEKIHGWSHGIDHESRKQRIKRLRRWDRLEEHYPDKFVPVDHEERIAKNFKLVDKIYYRGLELFVTSFETVRLPRMSDLNPVTHEFPPFEDWPRVTQYNGYCRFKSKPVLEPGYNGILSYVPVHGGITFASHKLDVSTYGFDTAHAGDEDNPLVRNVEWVGHQAAVMAMAIKVAAQYEPDYLRFKQRIIRAWVIDRYLNKVKRLLGAEFSIMNNFGAMLNVLSGNI